MSWGLFYYLCGVVDALGLVLGVLSLLLLTGAFAAAMVFADGYEFDRVIFRRAKITVLVGLLLGVIAIFIPTKKDLIIIGGLNMVESPITESAKEYLPKLKELIDIELASAVKKLKDGK